MPVAVVVAAEEHPVAIDPVVLRKLADMKPSYADLVPGLDIVRVHAVVVAVAAAVAWPSDLVAASTGQHAERRFARMFHCVLYMMVHFEKPAFGHCCS